ncbi:LOW QUALITY PROTEIN: hypothetical protein MAR_036466, partial [Mya arenaria]
MDRNLSLKTLVLLVSRIRLYAISLKWEVGRQRTGTSVYFGHLDLSDKVDKKFRHDTHRSRNHSKMTGNGSSITIFNKKTYFEGKVFNEIYHINRSPGMVERFNRTLVILLCHTVNEHNRDFDMQNPY